MVIFHLNHETKDVAIPVDTLTCRLTHVDTNTSISSTVNDNNTKGPQGTGGAITYMRRYTHYRHY